MVWAVLVAVGVAVVSMTLFGARFTRRPKDEVVDHLDVEADPNDPWAAWKPRPFDEMDRKRPRIWPVLAAFTGLVMVGAGFAGARQTLWADTSAAASVAHPTPRPYTVEVDIPATPSPKPTPTPVPATPAPTARPTAAATPAPGADAAAPSATPNGAGPSLSGGGSCSGGTLQVTYNASSAEGLKWLAVYVDGEVVKGGAISGTQHSGSYQQAATPGDHALEVSVEDASGQTTRRQYQTRCA